MSMPVGSTPPFPGHESFGGRHGFGEFEVRLPSSLARFGGRVRASLYGTEGAPVVVLLGGISANRFPSITASGSPGWWAGLAGEGQAIDPARHRILGVDFAADEDGKVAPSTADQAEVIGAALAEIGAGRALAIVGASYGGMTALSLAEHHPHLVDRLVIVSAGAEPHAASTAAREIQRRIVALGIAGGAPDEGLALARGLAMMTYRAREEFEERFNGGIGGEEVLSPSEPGAYLRARGEAYRSVMSPGRFLSLSASIDRHRIDPAKVRTPALLVGSTSDQLVPPSQMQSLAERLGAQCELHLLESRFGHDMFLKDVDRLSLLVRPFLEG
jgi:homoserine O-acetyltransferase/O-succinyltransferase